MQKASYYSLYPTPFIIIAASLTLLSIVNNSVVLFSLGSINTRSSDTTLLVFIIGYVIYSVSQFLMIRFLTFKNPVLGDLKKKMHILEKCLKVYYYGSVSILFIIVMQMILLSHFDLRLFNAIVIMSYGMSTIILGVLTWKLFSWFKFNHHTIFISYSIAIALLISTQIFSVVKTNLEISDDPSYITPIRNPWDAYSSHDQVFGTLLRITTTLYFIATWFSTVLILKNYSKRIGALKYWTLVTLPLIYFLGPIELYFSNLYISPIGQFIISNPINIIFFTAIRQSAGILFSVTFWTLSRQVDNDKIRYFMRICAIGILLLYGATQSSLLVIVPYPPFGLPDITVVVVSSFMLTIGLYYSAISVSRDSDLRRKIKSSILAEANILRDMGSYEVERELRSRVVKVLHSVPDDEYEDISLLREQDVHQYVKDVLKELKKEKNL
jgi:hypothetical protein